MCNYFRKVEIREDLRIQFNHFEKCHISDLAGNMHYLLHKKGSHLQTLKWNETNGGLTNEIESVEKNNKIASVLSNRKQFTTILQ